MRKNLKAGESAVTIRSATVDDALALSMFAARTFQETFAHSTSAENMAAHLSSTYSPELQRAELSDLDITTLIGEVDGQLVAFAMLRSGDTPSGVAEPNPMELWRFYVSRELHGRGLAQDLMEAVMDSARQRGAKSLWLGVWEHNERAKAFYSKHGFVDVDSQDYLVGTDAQTDRIYSRLL